MSPSRFKVKQLPPWQAQLHLVRSLQPLPRHQVMKNRWNLGFSCRSILGRSPPFLIAAFISVKRTFGFILIVWSRQYHHQEHHVTAMSSTSIAMVSGHGALFSSIQSSSFCVSFFSTDHLYAWFCVHSFILCWPLSIFYPHT
jgi:hypothetical protein